MELQEAIKKKHLDKSRPYGEVHPAGTDGVFFEQDGYPFDHEGNLVAAQLNEDMRKRLTTPPAQAKGKKAQAAVLTAEQYNLLDKAGLLTEEQKAAYAAAHESAQEGGSGGGADGAPPSNEAGDEGEKEQPEEVNLERWLKGEKAEFHKITKAVFERYQKKCTRKDDVVQFLVSDADGPHLVQPGEVAPAYKKYLDA